MSLVRAPALVHKIFPTPREISKYVLIVRKLFLGSDIQSDRDYHLWQYHGEESEKPPAAKYLDMLHKNNKHGFKSTTAFKGNPETGAG